MDDRLFATLDTKSRLVHLAEGVEALLTDTVGFIRHLPHGLVASFRSTLEEVAEADILLHVADAGHPYVSEHCEVVFETLAEIGADKVPAILVFNKCDTPAAGERIQELLKMYPGSMAVSALSRQGIDDLKSRLIEMISGASFRVESNSE